MQITRCKGFARLVFTLLEGQDERPSRHFSFAAPS